MDAQTAALPRPLDGLAGLVGLPTGLEARLPFEWLSLQRDPVWRLGRLPGAKGRPVLLVPGFCGTEQSLHPMRSWLRRLGFEAEVAPVGLNAGPAARGGQIVVDAVRRMAAASQQPVVIIGHSRGGQHGRVAAVRAPEAVAALVTLGTPLRVVLPNHALVRLPVSVLSAVGRRVASEPQRAAEAAYERDLLGPLPAGVRHVSVWSKTDGIVDWRVSIDGSAESLRVAGSHLGLAVNAEVYRALVSVLDRPAPRAGYQAAQASPAVRKGDSR